MRNFLKLQQTNFDVSKNTFTCGGTIQFDPPNYTKKHHRQAEWKRMAVVLLDGNKELCRYYASFVEKQYQIKLQSPLRAAHVSFISDRTSDMNGKWDEIKAKWNGKRITLDFDVDVRTNGEHWWLVVPEEGRKELHAIRKELGLGRPYFGMHMTIGYPNEHNLIHSQWAHKYCLI